MDIDRDHQPWVSPSELMKLKEQQEGVSVLGVTIHRYTRWNLCNKIQLLLLLLLFLFTPPRHLVMLCELQPSPFKSAICVCRLYYDGRKAPQRVPL